MRPGLAAGLLSVVAFAATTHAAIIDRIQITRAGLWTQDASGRPVFSKATELVPAKLGSIFGIEWRPLGKGSDGGASLKIRWLYPNPGLQHPVTRAYRQSDEFDYTVSPGTREVTVLELHSDYMLIPGKWVIEIGDSERPLARQEFTLAR